MGQDSKSGDSSLFRDAVTDVRPHCDDRIAPVKSRPPAIPRQIDIDNARVMDELARGADEDMVDASGDEHSYRANDVRHSVVKQLRRGNYRIQDEVDLHGCNADGAKARLSVFINKCRAQNIRCVRVVHGKGRRSPGREPVLKPLVARWLCNRKDVMAYVTAPDHDGGTGALYVLLRS